MDYASILDHPVCEAYKKACDEIGAFVRKGTPETPDATKRYRKAVGDYRDYLDVMGFKMPKTTTPHVHNDRTTWRYTDVILTANTSGQKVYAGSVMNAAWKYKDMGYESRL